MNYDNNTFAELMDAVYAQEGEHIDSLCTQRQYVLSGSKEVSRNGPIPGCGAQALFDIAYDGGAMLERITLCAVDDAVGAFPRFGGDRLAKLKTRELFFLSGDRLEAEDPRVLGR